MTNISQTTLPIMDVALDYHNDPNYPYSSFPNDSIRYENVSDYVGIGIPILVICIFGAMGNGIVIWLLGFRIKRNPFSTYIVNLAIADFGVLVSATFLVVNPWTGFVYAFRIVSPAFFLLFLSTYSTGQFLLMAIGTDRCVAVFFPLWHRCRRPPHLSTTACAVIWVLSVLFTAIACTLKTVKLYGTIIAQSYQFIVNAVVSLPVMTVATVSLFIKACLKARQHRRGRLLTIILLTLLFFLLFFLLFACPLNVMFILTGLIHLPTYMPYGALLLACFNSGINPFIYILVGRQWKSRRWGSVKAILQEVFKEEEGSAKEPPV